MNEQSSESDLLQKMMAHRGKTLFSKSDVRDEIAFTILMGEHYAGTNEDKAKEKWGELFNSKIWDAIGDLKMRVAEGTATAADEILHDKFHRLKSHVETPARASALASYRLQNSHESRGEMVRE